MGQPGFEPEGYHRLARLSPERALVRQEGKFRKLLGDRAAALGPAARDIAPHRARDAARVDAPMTVETPVLDREEGACDMRSEEHTSELQSLMRISYAVFCLKKKTNHKQHQ